MFIPNWSRTVCSSICTIGSFLLLNPLNSTWVPNERASISSEPVANANPIFTNSAHYASASLGASITGTPMNLSNVLASLVISLVMLIDLPAIILALSKSPESRAFFFSSFASFLLSFLYSSTNDFRSGGAPSKTQIGLTPLSRNWIVLWNRPTKCPVRLPSPSLNSPIPIPYLSD